MEITTGHLTYDREDLLGLNGGDLKTNVSAATLSFYNAVPLRNAQGLRRRGVRAGKRVKGRERRNHPTAETNYPKKNNYSRNSISDSENTDLNNKNNNKKESSVDPSGPDNSSADLRIAPRDREAKTPAPATMHIATFNTRTLTQEWRLIELSILAKKLKLDIIAIQEHRRHTSEQIEKVQLDNGWAYHLANASSNGHGGVGFLCAPHLQDATLSFTPLHHRIAAISLQLKDQRLNVVTVHMPTATDRIEETHECIDIISTYLVSKPRRDLTVIAGDLNADLPANGETIKNSHAYFNSNPSAHVTQQREAISDFIGSNELTPINAFLRQRRQRLVTFRGPNKRRARLDYVLIPTRWKRLAMKSRTIRPTCVLSDHAMVICSLTMRIWRPTRHKNAIQQPMWSALHDPSTRDNFTRKVIDIHAGREGYAAYAEAVMKAAELTLPKRRHYKKTPMWENNADVLMARRQLASARIADPDGNFKHLEEELQNTYNRARADCIAEVTSELNRHHERGRGAAVWKAIDTLTGRKRKIPTIIAAGSVRERIQMTKDHFQQLLNAPSSAIGIRAPPDLPHDAPQVNVNPITIEEINQTCSSTPYGKAAGPDEIPSDVLRLQPVTELLLPLMNSILGGTAPPPDLWRKSIIVGIPKPKTTSTAPESQRGLSLMCASAKVFNRTILVRIRERLEEMILPLHAGFREARNTSEQILSLRMIVDSCRSRKRNCTIIFVDFRKAFDCVDRAALQSILRFYGVSEVIVDSIMSLYTNTQAYVRTGNGDSEEFPTSSGVLQGDTLAPYLFVIVMDYVMRHLTVEDGYTVRRRLSRRHEAVQLTALAFADDVAILSNDVAAAQRQLCRLEEAAASVGLTINQQKTTVMHVGLDPSTPVVTANGNTLKAVTDFTYLGSKIKNNREAFRRRRQLAWIVARRLTVIWDSEASDKVKTGLFKSCVESVLLYSCEALTLTATLGREIDQGHRALLAYSLGLHYPHHVSSEELYCRADMNPASTILQKKRLGLIGHALRRPNTPVAILLDDRNQPTEPFRVGGAQLKTFYQQNQEDLLRIGLQPRDAKKAAQNRHQWSKLVKQC